MGQTTTTGIDQGEGTLQLDLRDNALVALRDLAPGQEVRWSEGSVPIRERIPAKHKVAATNLDTADPVTLYGVLVGRATRPVERGALLHTHNLAHAADEFGLEQFAGGESWTAPDVSAWKSRTFRGYRRADGRVGTANYWIVMPLVFCENRNLRVMERAFGRALGYDRSASYENYLMRLAAAHREGVSGEELGGIRLEEAEEAVVQDRPFPGVDGIRFLAHEAGCGCDRGDSDALCGLLAGYATHPNVAGVTVLSLGCQNATVSILEDEIARRDPDFAKPFLVLEQQRFDSERAFLETALRETFLGMRRADEWGGESPPGAPAEADYDFVVDSFPELARALGVDA